MRESWKRQADELGLPAGLSPVRWVLDVSGAFAVSPQAAANAEFFEAGQTAFVGGEVVVTLPARKYLGEPASARQVVAHEAAHALVASSLGSRKRYESLPRWFREGMALWLADEGELRLRERIAYTVFCGGGAESFLAGIPSPASSPTPVSYAESYLAFCRLKKRIGIPGLSSLLEAARGGDAFESSLARVLGESPEDFRLDALHRAKEEVRKRLPEAREREFREALRRRDERRFAEAAQSWRQLLAENPSGPLGATLRYLLAKHDLETAGDPLKWLEAKQHLEDLLSRPGVLWRPEALLLRGDVFLREGELSRARAAWREVLEAFGEDAVPASQARRRLGEK